MTTPAANISSLLARIVSHNAGRVGLQQPIIWPVLVGPTSAGKTTLVTHLAAAGGWATERLLLASQAEHEVLGIPRVVEDKKLGLVVRPALPEWAARIFERSRQNPPVPTIVFIDELDKASGEERMATLLTLLAERRLYNVVLPTATAFICAMQPPRAAFFAGETGAALQGRLVFIPLNEQAAWEFVGEQHRGRRFEILRDEPTPVALPAMKKSLPRIVDWLLSLWPSLSAPERSIVAYGCLPPDKAAALLAAEDSFSTPDDLIAALANDLTRVAKLSNSELLVAARYIWVSPATTLPALEEVLVEFIVRCTPEELEQGIRAMVNQVFEYAEANKRQEGGEEVVDILGNATEEEVAAAFSRALHRGGTARAKAMGLL